MQRVFFTSSTFRGVLLLLWVAAVSLPLAFLHAWHTVPLPNDESLGDDQSLLAAADVATWRKRHVLLSGCPCSMQVGRWLQQQRTFGDQTNRIHDIIVLVGATASEADVWQQNGWAVEAMEEKEVWQRYGVAGGPWLLIHYGQEMRYRGGHAPRRPSSVAALCDDSILRKLQMGKSVESYPAYGCTFTPELRFDEGPFASSIRFMR